MFNWISWYKQSGSQNLVQESYTKSHSGYGSYGIRDSVEINTILANKLQENFEGIKAINDDFMKYQPQLYYSLIIMNLSWSRYPPY